MAQSKLSLRILVLGSFVWFAGCAGSVHPNFEGLRGQAPDSSALYRTVKRMDDSLSVAFNAHNLDGLMALFAPDLEFYHDLNGLQSFAMVKTGFGGMFAQNNGIRRELVAGTFRVYPINNYGAIELGSHRFCHEENGRSDCGAFAFAMVWRRQADTWKITRVLS